MKCLAELDTVKKYSRYLSVASAKVDESKHIFRQRRSLRPLGQRWKRDEHGTTAVEFALIALPFLLTLLAIFEFGSEFVFQTALDEATTDASRQIRTGALQSTGTASQSSMAAAICSNLKFASAGCTGKLSIDVRVFQSFSAVSTPNPFSSGTLDPTQLTFQLGGPGNIVLVTTYYHGPSLFRDYRNSWRRLIMVKLFLNQQSPLEMNRKAYPFSSAAINIL